MRQLDIREQYYYNNNMHTNTLKHMLIKYNSITKILINTHKIKKSTATLPPTQDLMYYMYISLNYQTSNVHTIKN